MPRTQRVVVVTGGATGIGAAIAEALGRSGAFVMTMDPVVSVDGSTRVAASEQTTAGRIVEAGGAARASNTSVTDEDGVRGLFSGLVDEFGSLDAVVNVAGISRPTGFAAGTEEDWAAVLSVHLDGYLNVLRAALPIMAAAGHGRILGVTSGSGWRAANAGAYSCAKRAVAALTWQIGKAAPEGVTVNALSPIAATRMVTSGLAQPAAGAAGGGQPASTATSGGLALGSLPPPENLGPVGAYLASDDFSWCSGQVIFSSGSELAWITAPHLLEVARTADVKSLPHALETLVPGAFARAEGAQATNGGSNPRFGAIFDESPADRDPALRAGRTCLIVTDDVAWGEAVSDALASWGVECVGLGAWQDGRRGAAEIPSGFAAAAAEIARVAHDTGPIDAVVVALAGAGAGGVAAAGIDRWQQILDEHDGITDRIRTDAGWVRAVSDYAADTDRPVRVLTVTNATTAGGRSRAQAAAQLARSAHLATADRVDAFAISVETAREADRRSIADVVAHLVGDADVAALSGAEFVAASGWFGLRSHPCPAGTISFGGPAIPDWLDDAVRRMVTGNTT